MNPQDFAEQDQDLLVLTGSKLYGTSTPDSDTDYRGFVVPPKEYLLGMKEFNQYQSPTEDKTVYSMKQFFRELIKGNTQCMETLFAPDENIVSLTNTGREVLKNRNIFISRHNIRTIVGFAMAEWRKAEGVDLKMNYPQRSDQDLLERVYGRFQLDRAQIADILEICYGEDNDIRVKVPKDPNKLGEQRKKLVDEFGFDTKAASHTLRLLSEAIQLLEFGNIKFPLSNAHHLLEIKIGKVPFTACDLMRKEYLDLIDAKLNTTNLPKKLDINKIEKFYLELVAPHD